MAKKTKKKIKRHQFELEFIFKASPAILYQFITRPANLVLWFCDSVDIEHDVFTFWWDGSEEVAELIDDIEEERLKFIWEDAEPDEYLEFRMYKSDLTNETILEITDFADELELDEQKDMWSSQIEELKGACGG